MVENMPFFAGLIRLLLWTIIFIYFRCERAFIKLLFFTEKLLLF